MAHNFGAAVELSDDGVSFIDQRLLPKRVRFVVTKDPWVVERAIKSLAVRGAPLIGIAAAFAVVLAARQLTWRGGGAAPSKGKKDRLAAVIARLEKARPTAVNLKWALNRMLRIVESAPPKADLTAELTAEALAIQAEDKVSCEVIAAHGLKLLGDSARVLTICNTGRLATGGIGTAAGIIYRAFSAGRLSRVYVCETRPLMQGARLTVWEMTQAGLPVTLLVDSAAAGLIANGAVDICIIGADRIAANGDTANKVGSLALAVLCRRCAVPFIVAAPWSTIDSLTEVGNLIPIELRPPEEVVIFGYQRVAAAEIEVFNPAFDVVPAELISAIVTDKGILTPPLEQSIRTALRGGVVKTGG